MANEKHDQTCTRCRAKVTAKELRKGRREFYEFFVGDVARGRFDKYVLCTSCEVNQERFYKMEPFLPEQKTA